jgi:hypothetical protein
VLVLSLFASVQISATPEGRQLLAGLSVALVLVFILSIIPLAARATYSTIRDLAPGRAASRDVQWQVADGLHRLGVQPGDPVASIGNTMYAAWPRLARVRVVAEIPRTDKGDVEKFWSSSDDRRRQTLAALTGTGARVVVAENIPRWAPADKWQRIGNTNHYVYFMTP